MGLPVKTDYFNIFSGDGTTSTGSLTVGATDYVLAAVWSSGAVIVGVTIGGVAATLLANGSTNQAKPFALYGLAQTTAGAKAVVATYDVFGGSKALQAASFSGLGSVRSTSALFAAANNTAISAAVTTAVDDLVVLFEFDATFAATFTPTAPATVLTQGAFNSTVSSVGGCQQAATGTSTTIAGTLNAASPWGALTAVLIGASASTPIAFGGTVANQTGTVGTAFSLALASFFSGNLTPFTYSLFAGSLPAGLTLNTATGAISGTPTAGVTATGIVVRGTDASANVANTNAFSITIATIPSITTEALRNNTGTIIASTVIPKVSVLRLSDMVVVLSLTNQSTSAAGILLVQNAALVAATDYLIVLSDALGASVGNKKYTAVA